MEGVLRETAIQAKSLLRGVCLKGWGTGSRDSGCWEQSLWGCWNRRSMNRRSMNQGFRRAGIRDSVGTRASVQLAGPLTRQAHGKGDGAFRSRATCGAFGSQGYREAVTLAGRSTVRRGATLPGRVKHWLTACTMSAGRDILFRTVGSASQGAASYGVQSCMEGAVCFLW